MDVKNVKGTHDVYGEEANAYMEVENLMSHIAELFAFRNVRPPVLEYSEVFTRGVGESSDIVRKEMYTFTDKGDRSCTLRPEFTACIMRLVTQNKLYATNELPLKYYYCGPVFRYERPQLGRYRQFNQFGVESIGVNSASADVETIVLAYTILQSLGLENVTIKLNSLGDEETRNNYREALKQYFAKYIKDMCPDCQSRFELNPLRILDCKVEDDKKFIQNAPQITDYLSKNSKERFDEVKALLSALSIPFEVDDSLVRGLDYYSETVYEFHYTSQKGLNYGAVGAGGHYGNLMKEFNGPDYPGVGFSFGIERIVSVLTDDDLLPDVSNSLTAYVMPMDKSYVNSALMIASMLRVEGYSVDLCYEPSKLGSMFKKAEKKNSKYAIIIGENELESSTVVIKNMNTQVQETVKIDNLVDYLDELESSDHECDCGCGCHEDHECHCHEHKEK